MSNPELQTLLANDTPSFQPEESIQTLPGQIIDFQTTPTEEQWALVPLYNESAHGGLMIWQIGFDPVRESLVTIHGYINNERPSELEEEEEQEEEEDEEEQDGRQVKTGKIQRKERRITTNQSGRSIQQQALLEARSKYTKQYRKHYRPQGEAIPFKIKPMLAEEYWPGGFHPKERKEVKATIQRFPVACQAKLDGNRSLATEENGQIVMRSRGNKEQAHLDHIKTELADFFLFLGAGWVLDGELYIHGLSFQQLQSILKSQKKIHPRMGEVVYYIFDVIEPAQLPFEDRYTLLVNAYNQYLDAGHAGQTFTVLPIVLADSHQQLQEYHQEFVAAGYEGMMIRKLAGSSRTAQTIKESQYRPTRTMNLQKMKSFYDEEGVVLDVVDGEGTNVGLAIFVVQDPRGHVIHISPRGSHQERAEWFRQKEQFLGRQYQYRYFELSETGVPRFPTGLGFRDAE